MPRVTVVSSGGVGEGQGSIRMAVQEEGEVSPPPQTKVTIGGKKAACTFGKIWSGRFRCTNFLGARHPPPPFYCISGEGCVVWEQP